MLDELWNGEGFAAKDPRTGELIRTHSLLNLLPIVLGDRLPRKVTERIADLPIVDHLTEWGLATEPPTSRSLPTRRLLARPDLGSLDRAGRGRPTSSRAYRPGRRHQRRFRATVRKSGFAENFDALTGAGLRDRAYTWTASAYLVLAAEHEARTYLNRSDAVENGA